MHKQYIAFYDTGHDYGSFIFNSTSRANSKKNKVDAQNRWRALYGFRKVKIYKIQRCKDNE